jgi:hypothetical protein
MKLDSSVAREIYCRLDTLAAEGTKHTQEKPVLVEAHEVLRAYSIL